MKHILESERLHSLGYTWIIYPHKYNVFYNEVKIASYTNESIYMPQYWQHNAIHLQNNLQSVHSICENHNKTAV